MSPTRRSTYARARTKSHTTPLSLEPPLHQQSASPSLTLPAKQDPMSPSSRYLHNLRVIQRHDPTITSLFDQFPHVCVYHHRGDEWQKKGCEGAMFLFEREEEPKYGFYILNRNNTGDYIQRLTPDDDVELANAYLIYRAYGKVTSDTIGLWTMVTQDREAMSQVMMRLHSYIRRGERYPDMYRRKPETWSTTPAPTHAHAQTQFLPKPQLPIQAFPQTPTYSHSQPQFEFPLQSSPYESHLPAVQPPLPTQTDLSSSTSAFSNLIAKLDNSHAKSTTPLTSSPYLQTPPAHSVRSKSSVPDRIISASVPPQTTGIPLLDSIFASASDTITETPTPYLSSSSQAVTTTTLQPRFTSNGIGHSPSSSSGVTPTQPISDLPRSSSPQKTNGISRTTSSGLTTAMRGVLPFPPELSSRSPNRHGRESAPPGRNNLPRSSPSLSFGLPSINGAHRLPTPRRRHSSQYPHLSIPEAREEEDHDEDGGLVDNSAIFAGSLTVSASPPASASVLLSAGPAKRKGRKREGKRIVKTDLSSSHAPQQQLNGQNGEPSSAVSDAKDIVEWPLVDDRSLSVDGSEEGEISGLGDGLMDAIAALSESDAYMSGAKSNANGLRARGAPAVNGTGTSGSAAITANVITNPISNVNSNVNANGRGRRKRKPRERGERDDRLTSSSNGIINGTNGSASGLSQNVNNINTNVSSFPEITRAPSSSSASSHPAIPISTAEVRNAVIQTYGSRRRVGDAILGEKELKAEIVNLINNDATFMKELYQIYLRKVKV